MTNRFKRPTEKNIQAPEGGWKEHTMYLVEVAWNANNPIHHAVLHIGFLHGTKFGHSCMIWNNSYDEPLPIQNAYWVKPIQQLITT